MRYFKRFVHIFCVVLNSDSLPGKVTYHIIVDVSFKKKKNKKMYIRMYKRRKY